MLLILDLVNDVKEPLSPVDGRVLGGAVRITRQHWEAFLTRAAHGELEKVRFERIAFDRFGLQR